MNIGDFKIGANTYTAQTIQVEIQSLQSENSGRTEDGVMHIDWIYHKVRKFTITLPPSTQSTVSRLLDAIQGEYTLTIYDPIKGESSYNCYTSNSTLDLYSGVIKNGLWQNVTFSAIQKDGEK